MMEEELKSHLLLKCLEERRRNSQCTQLISFMHESLGVHNDLQPLSDEEFDYFISAKDSISSLLVHGEGD